MKRFEINHKNILLDVGDTLVSINQPFEEYTRRAIGRIFPFYKSRESDISLFKETVLSIRNSIRSKAHESLYEYSFGEFIDEVNKHFDVRISNLTEIESLYVSAELEITQLKKGVHQFLKRGKEKNKKFIVSTNNFSSLHVIRILEMFELGEYIDHVFISGEMKIRKPSVDFINKICNDLSIEKAETIIIGDKQDMDIKAAELSKIDSCFINSNEPDTLKSKPTYSIQSLDQLILI